MDSKIKLNKKITIVAIIVLLCIASIIGVFLLNNKKIEISENSQNAFLAAGTPVSVGENVMATFDSSTGEVTIYSTNGIGTISSAGIRDENSMYYFWKTYGEENVKTITIVNEVYAPDHLSYIFRDLSNLTTINNFNNLNIEKVTNMSYAFSKCSSLRKLDLSNWDTKNVTDMGHMFNECSNLSEIIGLDNLNTENVTNMNAMFFNCSNLIKLNLNNWNTENVTDAEHMFYNCSSLTELNLSNWDTRNLAFLECMFGYCSNLKSLDLSNWTSEKMIRLEFMFAECSNLTEIKGIGNWNTENAGRVDHMFDNCRSLISLDLSSWNLENVDRTILPEYMFRNCDSLNEIYTPSVLPSATIDLPGSYRNIDDLESDQYYTSISKSQFSESVHLARGRFISFDLGIAKNYVLPEYESYTRTQSIVTENETNEGGTEGLGRDILPNTNNGKAILWDEGRLRTETGYCFVGWQSSYNNQIVGVPYASSDFNKDITYTAIFEKITYTVKYNGNGATRGNTEDSTHTYGEEKALTPNGYERKYTVIFNNNYDGKGTEGGTTPKTSTYNFIGWSETEDGVKQYNDRQIVTNLTTEESKTLYAVWEKQSVSVSIPTRAGYVLEGWYKDSGCTEKVIDGNITEYMPEEDITLYAKWIVDESQTHKLSYIVEYYKDNNKAETVTIEKNVQVLKNEITIGEGDIDTSNSRYPGYRFVRTEPNPIPEKIEANGVIRVYYVIDDENTKEISYTVKYYKDGKEAESVTVTETVQVLDTKVQVDRSKFDTSTYKYPGYKLDKENLEIPETIADGEIINVYYVKDENQTKDVSYTVEYYKDEGKVEEKTINAEIQVLEENISIDRNIIAPSDKYLGYKLDETKEIPSIVKDGEIVKIYYVVDESQTHKLSYTVEYYKDNIKFEIVTVEKNVQVLKNEITIEEGDIDTSNSRYPGYVFDKTEPNTIPEKTEANGVIKVYYVTEQEETKEISYTVKYYKDGKEAESVTVTETIPVSATTVKVDRNKFDTSTYKYPGYKLDTENLEIPETISNGEIINVYYITDENQTKEVSYKVEYYKDEEKVEEETINLEIQVLEENISVDRNTIAPENKYIGYKLDETREIPTTVENNGVIKIYYVKDESQTHKLSYIVEYYKDNNKAETVTVEKDVQVLKNEITIEEGDIDTSNSRYPEYRFVRTEPNPIPEKIEANGVIRVYYVVDDENTKEISYTVKYYKDGEEVETDETIVTETVQVLDTTVEVDRNKFDTSTYKYPGYKLDTENLEIPETIANGEVINVYYVKDESQTKEVSYKVEYYKDEEKVEEKTITKEIHLLDENITVDSNEVAPSNKYIGYKLDETKEIPTTVEDNGVIKVYYVKDESQTHKLSYIVEYYKDNNKAETVTVEKDVQILSNEITIEEGEIDTSNSRYPGYVFDKTEPNPIPEKIEANGVIKVYYVTETKEISYIVKYYKDGEEAETDKTIVTETIPVSDTTVEVDRNKFDTSTYKYTGYKLDTENLEIPKEISDGEIINVYYIKDEKQTKEISYKVEYYKDGEKTEEETITKEIYVLDEEVAVDKNEIAPENKYNGYKLDEEKEIPETVKDQEVIKVYYVKDDNDNNNDNNNNGNNNNGNNDDKNNGDNKGNNNGNNNNSNGNSSNGGNNGNNNNNGNNGSNNSNLNNNSNNNSNNGSNNSGNTNNNVNSGKLIPYTGDVLPIIVIGVVIVIILANAIIVVIRKKQKKNENNQ